MRSLTHERILSAARALFAARGYRATSMQSIADQVGITKAALYYHFDSKEEILRELTLPLLDELEEALAAAESLGAPERVRWAAVEGYVDVHLRHRETLTMLVKDMTLLVQAPVADRFRAAIALANDLVAGPGGGLEHRVRASQAVAGLADPVVLFRDVPADRLRSLILDGARALLGDPPAAPAPGRTLTPARGRARGRSGGRPAALNEAQVARARELYAAGRAAEEIATELGVSRATVYRCLKT
ncbi:TetR family transcriptional regulator [Nonomuraea sp. NN258]|uniref:TetR family transcriptional regulator n=1 Tax=Nonomuraea antri TaxID=2730852 RepID=UPI0015683A40|nr:TetR family transcriptional regulator [Nonomuraea antri]NRQ39798.1 TetR family transcriptional regulator [Nonomuraea antri]